MAKQTINVGAAANDGNGDSLRVAFQKINSNADELYNDVDGLTTSLGSKLDSSAVDTDSSMAADSDAKVPSQKAVKSALSANVANSIHAATEKATPVDADELAVVDSAASNALKKLTWANVKATLKSYFDTIYQSIPGAWTSSFTTTMAASSNAITTVGSTYCRYSKSGKTCSISIGGTITTNGTGAGGITFTLPFSSVNITGLRQVFAGAELGQSGKAVFAYVGPNSSTLNVRFLDFSYPGADGASFNISGSYETA